MPQRLEVYTREELPQDWATAQDSLGYALTEQAKRTESAERTELLVQAVTVLRSALEVRTRNQSPENWAEAQKHLGNALTEQGVRTKGAKRAEFLNQAVVAYRSAWRFTHAKFFHEQVEQNLDKVEALLRQAKANVQ